MPVHVHVNADVLSQQLWANDPCGCTLLMHTPLAMSETGVRLRYCPNHCYAGVCPPGRRDAKR